MSGIVEGWAMLLENPLACSAIRSVQAFMAVTAIAIVTHGLLQLAQLHRLRRRWPLADRDSRVHAIFRQAAALAGVTEVPPLRVADDVAGACTIGFWRPDICVSTSAADILDNAELRAVLLHELAHAGRRDPLGTCLLLFGTWLLASMAAAGVVFGMADAAGAWHIGATRTRFLMAGALAAFALFRFLVVVPGRFLRELTCDDLAVRASGDPFALGAALVKMTRLEPVRIPLGSAFAFSELLTVWRVRRLLAYRRPRIRLALQRCASAAAIATLAASAAALL